MSAVLSEAETKFFKSGGMELDPSLSQPEPAPEPEAGRTPAPEVPPPAPAAEKPPAAAPAPAPTPAPEPNQVPLTALHEERRRRAEAEARATQFAEQFRQMQEQMQEQLQALQRPQQPPPDPNEDPQGFLLYQNQQIAQRLEQIDEWRAQQQREVQQQQQLSAFTQRVAAAEQTFRATHADYDQAAAFAMDFEDRRLQAFYPDPAQRAQVLRIEAANVLSQAVQQGRDPAEAIYQFARNVGFGAAPADAGGAPAAQTPAPAPAPAVADVAKTIQKGLGQQSTLSAGGSTPPSEMTPQDLAAISDPAEFNKQWGKLFRRR